MLGRTIMMKPLPYRTSIVFTPPQGAWLSGEAERLGITVSELVRRIIDQHREHK